MLPSQTTRWRCGPSLGAAAPPTTRARSRQAPRREIGVPLLVPTDRGAPGLGRGLACRFQRLRSPTQVNQLLISYPSVAHQLPISYRSFPGDWKSSPGQVVGVGTPGSRPRAGQRGRGGGEARGTGFSPVKPPVPDIKNL